LEQDRAEQDRAATDALEPDASDGETSGSRQLFNGRDLSGWTTYLGPPYGSTEPIGIDRDPRRVFSVVEIDGSVAIRISGEVWGALTTLDEFENYHLHAEFKWGNAAPWPPLNFRDSGLMYHSVGAFGAVAMGGGSLADPPGSGWFMRSMQLQIAEADLGSYASMGPITVEGGAFYVPATAQLGDPAAWNSLDIYVLGNESVHVVNDHRVVHVNGATLVEGDARLALTRGKIQLESESAEIYFRAITLTPIREIPPDPG